MKAALLVLLALAPLAAHGQLWDILLEGGLESAVLERGQAPAVSGRLVDHAGDPVAGAQVTVRLGAVSATSVSGQDGSFRAVLGGFDGLPGTHVANISFSEGERRGAASEHLKVSGKALRSEEIARELQTPTAQRYLGSEESDYAGDPLGLVLHRHYASLAERYLEALEREGAESERDRLLEEARALAHAALLADLESGSPGAGSYGGWRYDRFVSGLDDSVRGIIEGQLAHSAGSLERARSAMAAVLESGGTRAEARAAYVAHLELSQEQMDMVSAGLGLDRAAEAGDEPQLSDSASAAVTPAVSVDPSTGRVSVSAGGVSAEFVVRGGQLTRSD